MLVEITNGNWDGEEADKYIDNLETVMGTDNPDGLKIILESLGDDKAKEMLELKAACKEVIHGYSATWGSKTTGTRNKSKTSATSRALFESNEKGQAKKQLVFNPNASDTELIACLKDIIESMATVTDTTIKWKGDKVLPGTAARCCLAAFGCCSWSAAAGCRA